ncbi:MAG: tRNA (N(6)-L-threonylcarbamoyladenosine(37)-C(2))-methylthiotransferase MtaB [Candidatus Zixiibacteriota bacterium]
MKSKKVFVQTVGCRLNQYESERIATQLTPYGFERALKGEKADLYILNTCTVTHRADSDCRNLIRKAVRTNPRSRIVVTGCYVDNDPEKISGMEGVDLIIHNAEKDNMIKILPERLPDLFNFEPDKNCSPIITDFSNHNRAWIKISDGCNQYCSFCIIPTVRGKLRSRPVKAIIEEINSLVENGYKEIVLTGVHIGHYKNRKTEPQVKNLAALCRMIMKETDLYRLRISSIEPQTVSDELVEVYADANGRICRHMHIPLQSGSSRMLKQMRRPYNQKTYIKRVTTLKQALENSIIGADVIVGFPGETEEDFDHTRRLVESGLIDYLHVFSYSDRRNTPASQMSGKISPLIIKERNAILTRISNRLREESHKRQVSKVLEVISEHKKTIEGHYCGVSDNYVRVKLPGKTIRGRNIIKVRINSATADYVEGNIIP